MGLFTKVWEACSKTTRCTAIPGISSIRDVGRGEGQVPLLKESCKCFPEKSCGLWLG